MKKYQCVNKGIMYSRLSTPRDLRNRRFNDDNEIIYTEAPRLGYKTFDLTSIGNNTVIGVIGRRNSGKSTLVRDIIRTRFGDVKIGIVCSGSEKSNPFYRTFMPGTFAFCQSINEQHLEAFIQQAKENPTEPKLLIVDDCAFTTAQRKSLCLKELIFNGRHYGVSIIIVAQTAVDIGSPSVRGNIDYVFLTRENLLPAIEAAYKFFFSVFPSLKDFRVLNEDTKKTPYKTIVADMTSFGTITDMVKTYKAKL